MEKDLFIIINCDVDPLVGPDDQLLFEKETVWDETIRSISDFRNEIMQFEDAQGDNPIITWYLRSDQQIKDVWGDWCYPARKYISVWENFIKSGDEIGWHPHLWRSDKTGRLWYQEAEDLIWILDCLQSGYFEIRKLFDIKSAKTGWCFHNTNTMNLFRNLGIRYDLSAIPGIKNNDTRINIYDWENIPNYPYIPSEINYKIGKRVQKITEDLIEIPLSTFLHPFYLRPFTKRKMCAANLAKNPLFLKKLLTANGIKKCSILNTYFHPCDISSNNSLFSCRNFKLNLTSICKNRSINAKFITPRDLERILGDHDYD